MEIRRLREDEWEAWRELRLRALADDPDAFGSTLERELAYSDALWRERTRLSAVSDRQAMFVAEEGARLGGCAGAFLGEDGTPSVVSMWVEAAARGRGVGRALLGAVEEWARRLGKRRLVLHIVDSNGRAEAMYARAGFRRTGRTRPLARACGLLRIEMEKDLDVG